jgi:thymidylate kinase
MRDLLRGNQTTAKIIIISGPDGVGKTTQALELLKVLRSRGTKSKYVWLRFNHMVALPVLALLKIMNLNTSQSLPNGGMANELNLKDRHVLQAVYETAMLVDMALASFLKITIPTALGSTIVCDRYTVDAAVDIMVATRDTEYHRKPLGEMLLRLGPANRINVVMICNTKELRERREDLVADRHIDDKARFYGFIADSQRYMTLDVTGKGVYEVTSMLIDRMNLSRSG